MRSGVLMLARGEAFTASPAGLAAITLACLSWSLGSALSQRKVPLAPGAMGFASEMLCGSVLLLAVALAIGERPERRRSRWPRGRGSA